MEEENQRLRQNCRESKKGRLQMEEKNQEPRQNCGESKKGPLLSSTDLINALYEKCLSWIMKLDKNSNEHCMNMLLRVIFEKLHAN